MEDLNNQEISQETEDSEFDFDALSFDEEIDGLHNDEDDSGDELDDSSEPEDTEDDDVEIAENDSDDQDDSGDSDLRDTDLGKQIQKVQMRNANLEKGMDKLTKLVESLANRQSAPAESPVTDTQSTPDTETPASVADLSQIKFVDEDGVPRPEAQAEALAIIQQGLAQENREFQQGLLDRVKSLNDETRSTVDQVKQEKAVQQHWQEYAKQHPSVGSKGGQELWSKAKELANKEEPNGSPEELGAIARTYLRQLTKQAEAAAKKNESKSKPKSKTTEGTKSTRTKGAKSTRQANKNNFDEMSDDELLREAQIEFGNDGLL
ncbi:hypothetical protein KS4_23410 [Poriferisphaera corsica]|uniref:Uncharacterized protein n=1 Tax=Poriferisphaera corsica TaxID=2528020 RepID=A0A517YVL9_9BACT|nr:hypothetical protein [Poriferisphaera corsica]QDU34274.1 hypothetical protein KS4_23410 [Poriferisphaera corsica]